MSRLKSAVELVSVLRSGRGRNAFRRWKPFSIASYRLMMGLRGAGVNCGTVIDGGANIGQFARAAAMTFTDADVYSFEPLPEIAQQFRENLGDCPRVKLIQSCIGNQEGTIVFRQNEHSQASSVLPIQSGKDQGVSDLREVKQLEVPISRLDTLLADKPLRGPVLLKLDLQGFELEALKGATEVLKKCSHVLVETVFETFYEGEPLFEDLLLYLREAGFHFVRPLNFLRNIAGDIIQMDALFARRSH